jgi:arsenate reductase
MPPMRAWGRMARRILFLCTANSARSQIAEGLARHLGGEAVEVASAGAEPSFVHPLAVRVLSEIGIDITGARSKSLTEFGSLEFDDVVTVCDRAAQRCPVFPGPGRRTHWSLADPAAASGDQDEQLAAFRKVREELASRLPEFLAETPGQISDANS